MAKDGETMATEIEDRDRQRNMRTETVVVAVAFVVAAIVCTWIIYAAM
jgi:hypothetical protein